MNNGATVDHDAQHTTRDLLHEALELYNLESGTNSSSLLEYGLNLGFIGRRPSSGRLTIELLNTYPMSVDTLMEKLVLELLLRLGVFMSASGLVKMAIDLDDQETGRGRDREDAVKALYTLSIIVHQVVNFDETCLRTLNRALMCVAIVLFSLSRMDGRPCADMRKFKQKIKRRLLIDYYLWCLMFAINFVLTCAAPVLVNLEHAAGVERHICQNLLNTLCTVQLCYAMRSIGHGRLVPLIYGTPLLFMDAGDDITMAKTLILAINYFTFWLSDWRELVDWNHAMLCEAGICKILNSEPGNLRTRVRKAKMKFDEWRLEEGLDDDGWFILLDAPSAAAAAAAATAAAAAAHEESATRAHRGESAPASGRRRRRGRRRSGQDASEGANNDEHEGQYDDGHANNDRLGAAPVPQSERASDSDGHETDDNEQQQQQRQHHGELHDHQLLDYSERVIYLQSRNPLLTSLAAILLIVWK